MSFGGKGQSLGPTSMSLVGGRYEFDRQRA